MHDLPLRDRNGNWTSYVPCALSPNVKFSSHCGPSDTGVGFVATYSANVEAEAIAFVFGICSNTARRVVAGLQRRRIE